MSKHRWTWHTGGINPSKPATRMIIDLKKGDRDIGCLWVGWNWIAFQSATETLAYRETSTEECDELIALLSAR